MGKVEFYAFDGTTAAQKRLTKGPTAAKLRQLSLYLHLSYSVLWIHSRERESRYGRSLNTAEVQGSIQTLVVPLFKRAVPKFASYSTLPVQTLALWGERER